MEDVDSIRRMTPAGKIRQWRSLVRFAWPMFDVPDRAAGRRKWEAWEREHELSNLNLVRHLRERDL